MDGVLLKCFLSKVVHPRSEIYTTIAKFRSVKPRLTVCKRYFRSSIVSDGAVRRLGGMDILKCSTSVSKRTPVTLIEHIAITTKRSAEAHGALLSFSIHYLSGLEIVRAFYADYLNDIYNPCLCTPR